MFLRGVGEQASCSDHVDLTSGEVVLHRESRSFGLVFDHQLACEIADVDLQLVPLVDRVRIAQEGDNPLVDQICVMIPGRSSLRRHRCSFSLTSSGVHNAHLSIPTRACKSLEQAVIYLCSASNAIRKVGNMRNYRFSVVIQRDKDGYYAFCPELQGCYTQGDTYEAALENIKDAVRLHVEDGLENEEEIQDGSSVSLTSLEITV